MLRRQFLMAGGTLALAAAGIGTAGKTAGRAAAGAAEVRWDRDRAIVDGGEAGNWMIDLRQFGGTPRLSVTEAEDSIRIAVSGATYPGTNLAADLIAELSRAGSAGLMRLRMKLGRFDAQVRLADWLAGKVQAISRVDLAGWFTPLGAGGQIRLADSAQAAFQPDWQLRFSDPGAARITTPGVEAAGEALTVSLGSPDASSLLRHGAGRRTIFTLERGGAPVWSDWPALTALGGEGLHMSGNPFSEIRVEAMETQKGVWRQGLVARTPDAAEGGLGFRPGNDFTHPDGTPARLALRQPQFAVAFDPAGDQTALFARFGQEPAWICTRGCTLQVGDAPGARPFELVTRGGEVQRRSIAPAVLSMAAAMPGAVVEPIEATAAEPIIVLDSAELPDPEPVAAVPGTTTGTPGTSALPGPTPGPITEPVLPPLQITIPGVNLLAPAAYINVTRPKDLLSFSIRFVNLRLQVQANAAPVLMRQFKQRDSYIVYRFAPQAIAEKAFWLTESPATTEPLDSPAIPSRAAGPTWLAFRIPKGIDSVSYTLESLLTWNTWEQMTVSRITDPTSNDWTTTPVTAIEAPYRLYLSPSRDTRWSHSIGDVTLSNRTELWHTKLVHPKRVIGDKLGYDYNSVRAVWTPDLDPEPPKNHAQSPNTLPFNYAMDSRHRFEIVSESAARLLGPSQAPIKVENLMLSALGAWLKVEGKWEPLDGMSVCAWRHEAIMGRDQFVKVVEQGYLYPWGHLAVRITETQRQIEANVNGNQGAYLRKYTYILVLEREREYAGPESFSNSDQIKRARNLPLRKVTILTRTTPKLDPPETNPAYNVTGLGTQAFWPRVSGDYFPFHLLAVDWEGNPVEFAAPVIWVSHGAITGDGTAGNPALVQNDYAKATETAEQTNRRTADMKGQRIAFAPRVDLPAMPADGKPGDTLFETANMRFTAALKLGSEDLFPPWHPQMDQAAVNIPTLAQMTGTSDPQPIKIADHWLTNGFNPAPGVNPGYLFANLVNPPSLSFGGDKSGGVLTPDMALGGLSLSHGLVGGASDSDSDLFGLGQFNPKQFFGDKAKVLGGLLLSDILDTISGFTANGDASVPQISSRVIFPDNDKERPPEAIEANLKWTPKVKAFGPLINYYNADHTKGPADSGSHTTTCLVTGNVHRPFKNPASATYEVHGELNNFTIDIADCIRLGFDKLTFDAKKGQNLKTDVGLQWVVFEGPLEFIEKLREWLGNIFGDGFKLDVEPSGIRASFNLPIPNLTLGVFALKNMSLGAGLDLPFTGDKPALLDFHFCTRENPFSLTVMCLGGGGFFGITLSIHGIQSIEAALEFGASISIDLGVASGGVDVKAGIYFKYDVTQGSLLEGYVKIHGEMTIIVIASLSITLYLSLTYKDPNKCFGQATLTVEVSVLCFSASVDVHCERQFSGKEGDPPFSDAVSAGQWDEYIAAFA